MARRDPSDLFRRMELDMHRFTEEALRAFLETPGQAAFWQPPADFHETRDGWSITLELAGVASDAMQIVLSGDGRRLSVSGQRTEPATDRQDRTGCRHLEIYFGPFERVFPLPEEADVDREGIVATLRNGFLTVKLPRRRNKPAVRIIPVELEGDQ
ncbi:MAG: Hsp20/alpha crystallin family protein [Armatimonadota bacterium]